MSETKLTRRDFYRVVDFISNDEIIKSFGRELTLRVRA
jgi:hypothetical protein